MQPFYQDPDGLVTIYNADATYLGFIADEAIELTVTSPPYNLDMSYNGCNCSRSHAGGM